VNQLAPQPPSQSAALDDLSTPAVLIDRLRLEANLRAMQELCTARGTALWPHIKTHKMVPILRRQLEFGAEGATCAKVGEAEAMLPSGVRRIFIAHSLVQKNLAPRLRALNAQLDELILAVTSEAHAAALDELLEAADLALPVLLAIDTGLGREGVRSNEAARAAAERIRRSPRMQLAGLYTHEGHAYSSKPAELDALADGVYATLIERAAAIGGEPPLWPGCSVTATRLAGRAGVKVVRPGSYVFGDLSLVETTKVMPRDRFAATVLATVVDRPEPGLALIDAGSKVLSGDRTADGIYARDAAGARWEVRRVSEEHGFVTGEDADALEIGQRVSLLPAHVCPVINLALRVQVIEDGRVLDTWQVDARGRSD
jgi:D-serine deaminase-like pyridoxal phosphate-dependent protein